jgi:hypothetical protein
MRGSVRMGGRGHAVKPNEKIPAAGKVKTLNCLHGIPWRIQKLVWCEGPYRGERTEHDDRDPSTTDSKKDSFSIQREKHKYFDSEQSVSAEIKYALLAHDHRTDKKATFITASQNSLFQFSQPDLSLPTTSDSIDLLVCAAMRRVTDLQNVT